MVVARLVLCSGGNCSIVPPLLPTHLTERYNVCISRTHVSDMDSSIETNLTIRQRDPLAATASAVYTSYRLMFFYL